MILMQTKLSGHRSATTSPSYPVDQCPTFTFSRSESSLTPSQQCHSDANDVNANNLHPHRTVNRVPCESEGQLYLNTMILDNSWHFVETISLAFVGACECRQVHAVLWLD